MAGYFRRGHSCGLVADGSRGPARVAQKGVLYLARETQAPIVPAGGGRQPQNHLQHLGPL